MVIYSVGRNAVIFNPSVLSIEKRNDYAGDRYALLGFAEGATGGLLLKEFKTHTEAVLALQDILKRKDTPYVIDI